MCAQLVGGLTLVGQPFRPYFDLLFAYESYNDLSTRILAITMVTLAHWRQSPIEYTGFYHNLLSNGD